MSGTESEQVDTTSSPFVERDDAETVLPYDKGGVPFYVALLWVGFIVAYVAVMAAIALPDLRAWMAK